MAFIVKQPNGRYCRFGTIVGCPTHINMTRDDYIELCIEEAKERARREAEDVLEHHLQPYSDIDKYFVPENMTGGEFLVAKEKMSRKDNYRLHMEIL